MAVRYLPVLAGDIEMVEYRAYVVGPDGRFIAAEPLVCADDAEAIEAAGRFVDGHDVELWTGVRLVVRLNRRAE
jgi:hypothetical protein